MDVDWGMSGTLGHDSGCGLGEEGVQSAFSDMGMAVDWGRAQVSTLGHGNDCGLGKGTSEHFGTWEWLWTGEGHK